MSTTFNSNVARRLCRLAQLVYEDENAARAASGEMALSLVKWSWRNQGATHAGLWKDRDAVYLAFCGTNDWTDMLNNVSVVPLSHRWGRVHAGFKTALQRIEEEVLSTVDSLMRAGDRRLWVTGHSLGGALAVLMAARFQMEGIELSGLYTFGQPKAGNRAFKQHYNNALGDRTFRVVHRNDAVPRFMGVVFRHVGTFHGLGNASRRKVKRPSAKGPHRYGKTSVSSLPDHKIAKYLHELTQNCQHASSSGALGRVAHQ